MSKAQRLVLFSWITSFVAAVLAFTAWGQGFSWQFSALSTYMIFPLFGLLAFSLMWSHYIVAAGREFHGLDRKTTAQYFEITSLVVLAAICAHPGLLIWQLWRDGLGLPPMSYYTYVGPSLKIAVTVGSVSFLIFLAYEFRRKFSKKPWWRFVQYASDVAMLAILYHSLSLGSNLQGGWFRYVWFFYGVTLVGSLLYIYYKKFSKTKTVSTK
jgi:hypothetical protein